MAPVPRRPLSLDSLEAKVTNGCEPPDMDVGNQTQISSASH